jgi:hypothetical protein
MFIKDKPAPQGYPRIRFAWFPQLAWKIVA